jgi:hypothetical protein
MEKRRKFVVLYAALRQQRRNRGDDTGQCYKFSTFCIIPVGLCFENFILSISYLDMCAAVVNVFLLRMSMLQDVVVVSVREDTTWRSLFSLFFQIVKV